MSQIRAECNMGEHAIHILPPTSICPIVLDRQRSLSQSKRGSKHGSDSNSQGVRSINSYHKYQSSKSGGLHPLFVARLTVRQISSNFKRRIFSSCINQTGGGVDKRIFNQNVRFPGPVFIHPGSCSTTTYVVPNHPVG